MNGLPQDPEQRYAFARNIGRPSSVLDVGCAGAMYSAIAKERGARVVGIDERSNALAVQRLDEFVEAKGEALLSLAPLKGRTFELILSDHAFHHAEDPEALLRTFADHLEGGGHVLVSFLAPGARKKGQGGRVFSRSEVVQMVERAGLDIMRIDVGSVVPWAERLAGTDEIRKIVERPSSTIASFGGVLVPTEAIVAQAIPSIVGYEWVVVARKPNRPGKLSLTVGMLTLNEESAVEKMIDEIRQFAPDAKILLVDSSSDQTPLLAEAKGARVIRQLPARGHGPAMERLMYEAAKESEALIYLDCDFTYPANMIPRIRELLEQGADVVNASRTHRKPEAMPLPNFLANRVFAGTAQVVHGIATTDVHSGMRGYRSTLIRAFNFDGEGDAIPLDTLILPAKSNYDVIEMPIDYHERVGQSKLAKFRGTVWSFARIASAIGKGKRVRLGSGFRKLPA